MFEYDEVVEVKKNRNGSNENIQNESGQRKTDNEFLESIEPIDSQTHAYNFDEKSENSFDTDSEQSKEFKVNQESTPKEPYKITNLNLPKDIENCFQYISKYTPQTIQVEYFLQLFVPEYIPAVGDVDAFIKVTCPKICNEKKSDIENFINTLGISVLDEPSGSQSDPSLLHIKLKSIIQNIGRNVIDPKIVKNNKDIDKWIKEINQHHLSNNLINYSKVQQMQNIDKLMCEWPKEFETALNNNGFPSWELDCSLSFYIKLICSIFHYSIPDTKQSEFISSLYTLYNLYLAIKETNSKI